MSAHSASLHRHPEFVRGLRDSAHVYAGISAWALVTGVTMVKSGMSTAEAVLMAVFVYAGSSQLAAITLIAAGAPMWVIFATAFCVNLRFVVFSAHLRPYWMHMPLWRRLLQGYVNSDTGYVLFVRRYPRLAETASQRRSQEAYAAGMAATGWCSWVGMSLLGIALANYIPTGWNLGFSGILALAGVGFSLMTTRLRAIAAAVAGVIAVAAFALPLRLNIMAAVAAALLVCLALEKPPPPGGNRGAIPAPQNGPD